MKNPGTLFTDTLRQHHRCHHGIFESFGIYRGQPQLFFALYEEREPINQTRLAEKMHIAPSTLTRMVQSLEKKGFITRHIDEHNQRQTLIALTPEGRVVHDQIKKRFTDLDEIVFSNFTAEEKEQLTGFLLRIQKQLQEIE